MIWLADAVLVVHALIALFIVSGLPAIWIGSGLGWKWVRSRAFRLAHLYAIGLVSALSLLGLACPLTVLEDWLRNGSLGTQGFLQRWVSRLLYYDVSAWVFTLAYVADLAPGSAPRTHVTCRRSAAYEKHYADLQPAQARTWM